MDALADLLAGVRARSAAFCRTVLEPPWALRIADGSRLALATVTRGHAWLVPDEEREPEVGGEPGVERPVRIDEGQVAVVKGPAPARRGRRRVHATLGGGLPRQPVDHSGRNRSHGGVPAHGGRPGVAGFLSARHRHLQRHR